MGQRLSCRRRVRLPRSEFDEELILKALGEQASKMRLALKSLIVVWIFVVLISLGGLIYLRATFR
jgi:hypothetical protein